jgi:hypothetical protein
MSLLYTRLKEIPQTQFRGKLCPFLFFIFIFYMSTQGKEERGFELVTSASLDVVHNQLS